MNVIKKSNEAYKTIGEVTKDLGLFDKKNGSLQTHTIRYWETQFKQIKPTIRAGKRRYYSNKDVEIIKKIKFLLKDKGLTINVVKKIMSNQNNLSIDGNENLGLYTDNQEKTKKVKQRIKKIVNIIIEFKKLTNG